MQFLIIHGGIGGVWATIDGVSVTNWKCVSFSQTGDPESEFPGCTYPDYDDSAWTLPLV